MKFYFSYVMGLKEPSELDDEADHRILGLILHAAMEEIYGHFGSNTIQETDLKQLLGQEKKLEQIVDNAFRREYFNMEEKIHIQYSGQQLLLKMTILAYVKNVLSADLQNCVPFQIVGVETKEFKREISVEGMRFTLSGTIDRLQKDSNGTYRIIDYKTGSLITNNNTIKEISFPDIPFLFNGDDPRRNKHSAYALQVMLYAYLCTMEKQWAVTPSLSFVRYKEGLIPLKIGEGTAKEEITSITSDQCDEVEQNLVRLLREMFSSDIPFKQTTDEENCGYCPFAEICKGRKKS